MSQSTVGKLLDAKDPDAIKLWADQVFRALQTMGKIKRIQAGSILLQTGGTVGQKAATEAVDEIDLTKYVLLNLGCETTNVAAWTQGRLQMLNATTVGAYGYSSAAVVASLVIGYELVEYE